MEKLILIDGNSLINRAFYALPPLNNAEGTPTQAVYGFTTMLIKAINDFKPNYMAVAFDLPVPTFRHKMYDGYKANRKGMPDELAVQMPILKRMLRLMNIAVIEKEGFEADDIIGTLAKRFDVPTVIVTGDRDSLQLIDESTTVMLTKRGITETELLDEKALKEHYGLSPAQVIDYKSLAGDSSDCIPGVKGIGEKTALSLIEKYGGMKGIYSELEKPSCEITGKTAEKLREGKPSAEMSYKLASIDTSVPLNTEIEGLRYDFPFSLKVRDFFGFNAFRSLYKREDIFTDKQPEPQVKNTAEISTVTITDTEKLSEYLKNAKEIAFYEETDIYLARSASDAATVKINADLIGGGIDYKVAAGIILDTVSDTEVKKYVFDAKALMHRLQKFNAELKNYDDIKLMRFLTEGDGEASLIEAAKDEGYDGINPAAALFLLKNDYINRLKEEAMESLYTDVELPLTSVLYRMERHGVHVDRIRLEQLGKKFSADIKILQQKIYELCGIEFNINSPKQLSEVLFDRLKIPYPKKNAKKKSTGAEILTEIRGKHEVVSLIEQHRATMKLYGTYIEGFKKLIGGDGIVHTEYKQMLTSTGRLSSVEPNLQNIPVREEEGKQLRALFVAPKDKVLISADYSQIELRLLAHFSGDPKMLEMYKNGSDIHTMTAAEVFGVLPDSVTPKMRREAKTVNFGIIYGISEYGLAQNLGCPVSVAKRYIETYFERFSSIKAYFDGIVEKAKKDGYTTSLLGRRRKIPELFSPNFMTRQFGVRAAMNMPLQGSAADIIKIAMVKVDKELKNTKSALILQIHDELIIEADISESEKIKQILVGCMENAVKLNVPLKVDVGMGQSWLDC